MLPYLALLVALLFILYTFCRDLKSNPELSPAVLLVVLWCIIAASRPVEVWLYLWGVEGLGSDDPTAGSIFERGFYASLTAAGIVILRQRKLDWNGILRENRWILFLFLYMTLSIVWSDYAMVSLKRVVKSFGALVMALVILTDLHPTQSIKAALRRCFYIHVPFSVITIKYFRHIGVMWNNWSGEASWVGISTSKNTLGQVAAISALFFISDWMQNRGERKKNIIPCLYLLMSLYLLKGSDNAVSMTSLSVFAICVLVFWRLRMLKSEPARAARFFKATAVSILGVLCLVLTHAVWTFSETSLLGKAITLLGRDITLTGRTEIWNDIFVVASRNPVLGVGYGAFWIGRLVNIPWTENLSWVLSQAHNGYVDTYLQLGWVGVCLLLLVILCAIPGILRSFAADFEYGQIRMTFFLVILFVNITESTFLRGDHFLWLLFLLTAVSVPLGAQAEQATALQTWAASLPLESPPNLRA